MAHLGLAYGTLLFGLLLYALSKPERRVLISFITCVIAAFIVLMAAYLVLKSGNPFSDVFTSFDYISVRIRLTPQLAILLSIAAIISVFSAILFCSKKKNHSWIIMLATFFVYFAIGIDSITIAFISFILFCISVRYLISRQ